MSGTCMLKELSNLYTHLLHYLHDIIHAFPFELHRVRCIYEDATQPILGLTVDVACYAGVAIFTPFRP
uniref:Uncharacterized protein n=1 Tax=Triticum urartu TaxID=4572 RepID=A0A8R7QPH2_TRIUA